MRFQSSSSLKIKVHTFVIQPFLGEGVNERLIAPNRQKNAQRED
jgi:hypothetical protein